MERAPGAPLYPPLELVRRGDRLEVHSEVPGLTWRDLRIDLCADQLFVAGERRPYDSAELDAASPGGRFGRFCRWLPLDVEVVPHEMKVRLRDGVLHLEVPIAAGPSPC
jgi:HSP20 family molecular chaperone IbpA